MRGYTRDQLLDDYRLTLLWHLGGTGGWLARMDMTTLASRARALVDAIFDPGRLLAALEDHRVALLEHLYASADTALDSTCRWRTNRNA